MIPFSSVSVKSTQLFKWAEVKITPVIKADFNVWQVNNLADNRGIAS